MDCPRASGTTNPSESGAGSTRSNGNVLFRIFLALNDHETAQCPYLDGSEQGEARRSLWIIAKQTSSPTARRAGRRNRERHHQQYVPRWSSTLASAEGPHRRRTTTGETNECESPLEEYYYSGGVAHSLLEEPEGKCPYGSSRNEESAELVRKPQEEKPLTIQGGSLFTVEVPY